MSIYKRLDKQMLAYLYCEVPRSHENKNILELNELTKGILHDIPHHDTFQTNMDSMLSLSYENVCIDTPR